MTVMGVNCKTLRLLKGKHLGGVWASCLSGANELCGPFFALRALGTHNCSETVRRAGVAYPITDPAVLQRAWIPAGDGTGTGMSQWGPLSCFRWDSSHSKLIFGWFGLPLKLRSAALLNSKAGPILGGGFDQTVVSPFLNIRSPLIEKKDS